VAFFLVMSASPKKFDRYGLVLLVPLAVVVGLAVDQWIRSSRVHGSTSARAGGVVGVAMLAYSAAVAPWGLAYFNPALGGSRAGAENLLVGWGEGAEVAAARIAEQVGDQCDDVTVSGIPGLWLLSWECTTPPLDGEPPDYVVLYISQLQRDPDVRARVADDRELVDVVDIRGIRYAEIWR
jgi:hypothetical protein